MKCSLIVSLSALALSLTTIPAFGNEVSVVAQNSTRSGAEITPFNLVTRSYQGYFADQGIPSNGAFLSAVRRGKVTANDLVAKAIEHGRLAPGTINDQVYINNVNAHLNNLDND